MKSLAILIAALCTTEAIACAPLSDTLQLNGEGETTLNAFVALEVGPVSKPFDIGLSFCGDVASIERVEVAAIMPAHQHGMNYEPKVSDLGGGHFTAQGMVFHMPGTWRLQVAVYGAQDPSFFNLEVEAR
jgi:hypothetical protein